MLAKHAALGEAAAKQSTGEDLRSVQMQMATQHWSAHLLLDYHAEYLDHVQVLLILIASGLRLYACNLKGVVPARQHACRTGGP